MTKKLFNLKRSHELFNQEWPVILDPRKNSTLMGKWTSNLESSKKRRAQKKGQQMKNGLNLLVGIGKRFGLIVW